MLYTFSAPSLTAVRHASIAVLPPPTIATFFPRSICSFLTTLRRKSIPPITPSASSPGHPTPVDSHAPIPRTTASKSFLIVSRGISTPIFVFGTI